jgi:hypothetical protein
LAHCNVDTVKLFALVLAIIPPLLVKDGVNGDSSFACLTVTNDKFTLATTNGYHGIYGLETCHHGLVDGTTRKDTRSLERGSAALSRIDRTLAINGIAKGINDTAKKTGSDGNVYYLTGTLYGIPLLDKAIVTEDGDANVVSFQVETHAANAG